VTELGYPVVSSAFGGLFAPRGLPAEIAGKIEQTCEKVANDERFQRAVRQASQKPVWRSAADFATLLAVDFTLALDVKRLSIREGRKEYFSIRKSGYASGVTVALRIGTTLNVTVEHRDAVHPSEGVGQSRSPYLVANCL